MTGPDGPLVGVTVLLVEDVPDTRDVLQCLLEAEGARVWSAGTGREAAELAAAHEVDVVLTDLGLPDIPGDLLIRKVVAEAPRRPAVIAITGYGEPQASEARRAGADRVLTKPVAWEDLREHLAAARTRPTSSGGLAA